MSAKRRSALLAAGAVVLGALGAAELPYVNWRRIAAPLDARPLVIRQDAKGNGRFQAPRSGGRTHRGVDVAARLDDPVRAIRSGRVATVGTHRGLGRFVEVQHRWGYRSLYAHLRAVTVTPGQRVRQGQVLGAVGKTGNARHAWITPHLHLEVLRQGAPVDPQTLGLRLREPLTRAAASAEGATDDEDVRDGG